MDEPGRGRTELGLERPDLDGVTAVADAEMPPLTAAMVRETLERVRR